MLFPAVSTELGKTLELILKCIESPFEDFLTEHKLISFLEKNDLYKRPKEFTVDSSNLVTNLNETNSKVVLPNVQFNFSKFLGTNNMLKRITNHMKDLKSIENIEKYTNFFHSLEKKKKSFEGKLVITYLIYADLFEINNPLGSKSGKHTMACIHTAKYCVFHLMCHRPCIV